MMSTITDMAATRLIHWMNSRDFYPMGVQSHNDARMFVTHSPGDWNGEDIMDDAKGMWPRGSRVPIYVEPLIRTNRDFRDAVAESYLDKFGLEGLGGVKGAVEQMLMKRPRLMFGPMDRAQKRGVDVSSQVLLEQLSAREQWPWMNDVYDAGARDLIRTTRIHDWDRNSAKDVMDRYARWQVARELLSK